MAAGMPEAVSMNWTSGVEAGSNRSAGNEKNIPRCLPISAQHLHHLPVAGRIGKSEDVLAGRERDARQRDGPTEGKHGALVIGLRGTTRSHEAGKQGDRASETKSSFQHDVSSFLLR